jgi:hypothetical protein
MTKCVNITLCCKCHIIEAEIYNDCGNFCCRCWNDITDSSPSPNSVLSMISDNHSWADLYNNFLQSNTT